MSPADVTRLFAAALLVTGLNVHAASSPASAREAAVVFSPAEIDSILQHGPWPPRPLDPAAPLRDAGNPVALHPQALALGQQLFFDRRLSADGRLACASCHDPAQAFTDGRARSVGRSVLDRNAPSLWNAVHQRWYGWDGATDSLWSQALGPLFDAREMATSAAQIGQVIAADPDLACRYWQVFARDPAAGNERTAVDVAQALGAFVASLVSRPTPFDRFRDALARGDARRAARYPLAAQRGLQLFVGRARCNTCHAGPLFSNGEFADIGRPHFVRPGVVDAGRHAGIAALQASRHNLLSAWGDARPDEALKTRHVAPQQRNFGEFKVPSLRNVALTAPYTHDGSLARLDDVVRHYDAINLDRLHADGERILRPLGLSAEQRADLEAFLGTLSDPGARRWRPRPLLACQSPDSRPGAASSDRIKRPQR